MKTLRDKQYMHWLRQQACCVSGDPYDTIAHHVRMGANAGIGMKPSDYRTVPLSPQLHVTLHNNGEREFWYKAKIDPLSKIVEYLIRYLNEKGWTNDVIETLGQAIHEAKGSS